MAANYTNIRRAVEDEKELLKLMSQLPEAEFNKLMQASASYADGNSHEI
jgi:hypothetical protein